jgi:hypothetical protein
MMDMMPPAPPTPAGFIRSENYSVANRPFNPSEINRFWERSLSINPMPKKNWYRFDAANRNTG